ncbi:MAG: asparagine synthase (glutamine-hydrolyzing) [Betaproteobacteria bacterium RIFCSPLOWO2_02_FULL_66_14]|nr:MAG: asparagine synthase (glutamine-hydrolyzing) [Betaproteobacteria bacterium RIFCSPLOWO2_02_FULL_66_14]
MCGIVGLIATPWQQSAAAALATIRSRGPDEQRLWNAGEAILGNTRLAVIDPAGGQQPMPSAGGRYVLVHNGEIYNFRELRAELEALGHSFATRSDTEVLLHGYAAWGPQLPARLDGMFAFAIWDCRERTLFLARDRVGVKPLFYSSRSGFAFASTLEAFFALQDFPRRIDYEALRDYLAFQVCLAPQSFLRDVRQLPPASWLLWRPRDSKPQIERYWDIPRAAAKAPPLDEALERVDRALGESVRRQLVADVPLGAFLSGGIDSSLMVRYMAEAGARPLETFTLAFAQAEFDETGPARAVASAFGCRHHVLEAPTIDGAAFANAVRALDQPLADPAYVMTRALSELTRRQVTVAISGDGGDELFAGYSRFADEAALHPARLGQASARALVDAGILPGALLRRTLYGRELIHYRRVELGPWSAGRKSLARYLAPAALAACRPEATLERWRGLAGTMDTASLMRADLWTYLSENCLAKADRASMGHGLEVRVPMLGNPVLEAVLELPSSVHYDAGGGKALLRALARRSLPREAWDRPKHGFSVPLRELFSGPWREAADRALAGCAERAPYLDAGAVRRLWEAACGGRGSRRLAYTFVVLLLWLETHAIEP